MTTQRMTAERLAEICEDTMHWEPDWQGPYRSVRELLAELDAVSSELGFARDRVRILTDRLNARDDACDALQAKLDQARGDVATAARAEAQKRLALDAPLTAWAKWYSGRLERISGGSGEDYTGYEQDLFEALGCRTDPFSDKFKRKEG